MQTTQFGINIIRAAEDVLAIGYRAGTRNQYGEKLEQLWKEYDAHSGTKLYKGAGNKQADYCGGTVSVILDRATRAFNGQSNKFRSASAKEFENLAKKFNIRIDNTPRPGCLFTTLRSGGSGRHVGLVWQVIGENIQTIEGNTYCSSCYYIQNGCKVKLGNNEYGIVTRLRPSQKNLKYAPHCYIHVEELFGTTPLVDIPKTEAMLADKPAPGTYCDTSPIKLVLDGGEGENTVKNKIFGLETKELLLVGGAIVTIGSALYLTFK